VALAVDHVIPEAAAVTPLAVKFDDVLSGTGSFTQAAIAIETFASHLRNLELHGYHWAGIDRLTILYLPPADELDDDEDQDGELDEDLHRLEEEYGYRPRHGANRAADYLA